MRIFNTILCSVVAGLVALACSSDDEESTPNNSCGDPVTGGNDCPAYVSCAETKCDAEYKQCLGNNFKSGDFSGSPCDEYMSCVSGCNCDQTCLQGCSGKLAGGCQSCLTGPLASCISSSCSAELQECSGSGGSGGGTGGTGGTGSSGGTCADLQSCCSSLSGSEQTQCQGLYDQLSAGGDAACNTALQSYVASGKC